MRKRHTALVVLSLLSPLPLAGQAPARSPESSAGGTTAALRLTFAPSGNEARFVVREQLARVELPNDAVGKTSAITGQVVLDRSGKADPSASKVSVDLRALTSDRDRRDNFIKRRTIVTDSFPTADLAIRELRGLPATLPSSGTLSFELAGDLTVHGVTKPTLWQVTATAGVEGFTGRATTHVTFADFNMEKPRLAFLLSVAEEIRLELDFTLLRAKP